MSIVECFVEEMREAGDRMGARTRARRESVSVARRRLEARTEQIRQAKTPAKPVQEGRKWSKKVEEVEKGLPLVDSTRGTCSAV